MPNNSVQSAAVLGFKVGTQARVNELIAAGANAGAAHGTFYLAQDTHRLYIGNEDTSLSPVNEGITTVASINQLPTFSTSAQSQGAVGQFYYITGSGDSTDQNILCVYNGRGWVQINTNTDSTIQTFTYTVETDTNSESVMRATVQDSGNHGATGRFKMKGKDGATVSYSSTTVTIGSTQYKVPLIEVSADYEIGVVENNGTVSIKLSGEGNNDSQFDVVPAADSAANTNITITKDGNNLSIASRDTRVQSVAFSNNSTSGFDLTVTDNYLTPRSATLNPQIEYGATPVTATFVNGKADLDIYSKNEIDDLLTALNAMTYIGTYNIPGSTGSAAATAVDTFSFTNGITASLNGNPVKFHVGDTILVAADPSFSFNGVEINKGSLMIARGTEDANGEITQSTLVFDVVQATHDTDTTYRFEQATDGVYLMPSTGNSAHGGLVFTGGTDTGTVTNDLIKVSKTYANAASGTGKIATITVEHKDVARTNTTGTAVIQTAASRTNSYDGSTTVNVVTAITTNESGHITGVETTEVTLHDTNMHLTSIVSSIENAGIYTNATDSKNVGVLKTVVSENNATLANNSVTGYSGISSKSLSISKDTQTVSLTDNTQIAALNIEMVWGSF